MIKKYQAYRVGKPKKIIKAACKTVGLPLNDISKILTNRSEDFDDLSSISVGDWCFSCSLLQLDIGCIQRGYSSDVHKRNLGEAMYHGNYCLPLTIEIKEIWKSYKVEMKNQREDELKHYGGGLKRKKRLGYLKSDFQAFFLRLSRRAYQRRFKS